MNTNTENVGIWQEVLFVLLGVLGLIGSWAQVSGYLDAGFMGSTLAFWKDALTSSPASLFLVVDITILGGVGFIWMFGEGRRLGISSLALWGYFLGSLLIAISFAFPLFMAHRQRRLRRLHPDQCSAPTGGGFIIVAFVVLSALTTVAYSLTHLPG